MLAACIDWLADWTEDLPPLVDEYDLTAWLENEGCECLEVLLKTGFRKPRTRQEALEVLRGVVWEWYLSERDKALAGLPTVPAAHIERLLHLPQTAQKTAAWYAEARDLLTGHEFAGVVYGTPVAFEAAVAKKCAPAAIVEDTGATESRTVYCSPLSAFQWGWRYESVIRTLYEEEVADGRVCDTLGRIRHPTLPRLAASPDGLILEGVKAGRLLEIKAPVSRKLTGVIPADYYCQMQLQAEVAEVPAVEYVEVRFDSIPAEHFTGAGALSGEECAEIRRRFLTPVPSTVSPTKPERMGAILVVAPAAEADPETWQYAYSPIWPLSEAGLDEALCWKPVDLPADAVILEHAVWRVADWWTTTVPRNQRWWSEVGQPAYERFWEVVDAARATGKYLTGAKPPTCLIVDDDDTDDAGYEEMVHETKGCLIADSD